VKDFAFTRRLGLIAGITMSFTAAIGMIENFNKRVLVEPFILMGYVVLLGVPILVGLISARGRPNPLEKPIRDSRAGAVSGLIAGLFAGLVTSVFVLIVDTFDMTQFFPNMRPAMVEIMTFGFGVPIGLLVLILVTGVAGSLGGFIFGQSDSVRRGIGQATIWVLGFALFEGVVNDILEIDPVLDVIYAPNGGLLPWSAVVIGAVAWWLSGRFQGKSKILVEKVQKADKWSGIRWGTYLLGVVVLLLPLFVLGGIVNELLINVAFFVLLGLGLNIVVGYAGLLDLGYVAFFAVGAYGIAVLTSPLSGTINPEFSWWVALPIVMALAALAGLVVGTPVLKMRGDYLAIVTLGFGEIVRILLLSDWLTPIFGGAQGVRQIPGIPFFGTEISGIDPQYFIYFTLFFVAIAAYISYRAEGSRVGRSWAAMREDEDVAEATGISTIQAKLLAFVTGAIVASFAGALFAAKVGVIFTNSFDVLVSIIILVVVIVGGMGSIPGVAVGAFVLIGILGGPKSQGLLAEFAQYKLLIYGALLVFMMLKRPEGLLPSVRRSRELHLEELEQDAWLDKGGDFGNDEVEATT